MSATATMVDPLVTAYPFFDAAVLRDLVGREVVASGLRHKPGVSTTATLTRPDGRPWGWAQVLQGDQPDKIANARRRASDRGHRITVRALSGGSGWFLCGRIGTDPRLHRAYDDVAGVLPSIDVAVDSGTVQPLRYNALRRLVLRATEHSAPLGDEHVVRLTAHHQEADRIAIGALAGLGVPVKAPVRASDVPRSRRVTVWPWIEGADLAELPDAEAARAAGAGLAALHNAAATPIGLRVATRVPAGDDPDRALHRVVEVVREVAPSLTRRLDDLLVRLPERVWLPVGIIHGDFSADQVIHGADAVQLADLDRLQLGEPHQDLGGFAASELRRTGRWGLTPDLLAGYRGAVRRDDLTAWTAHALLLRLTEPFRAVSPTWLHDMDRRLDEVEMVLSEGVLR